MIAVFRVAAFLNRMKVPFFPRLLYLFNRVFFAVVLPPTVKIGRGVVLGYQGLGTVVHSRAVIEDFAVLGSNVTIGGKSGLEGVPVIGYGAYVGTGARVLGPIRVGRFAVIGANPVVIDDVPDYGVVAGVPARLIRVRDAAEVGGQGAASA